MSIYKEQLLERAKWLRTAVKEIMSLNVRDSLKITPKRFTKSLTESQLEFIVGALEDVIETHRGNLFKNFMSSEPYAKLQKLQQWSSSKEISFSPQSSVTYNIDAKKGESGFDIDYRVVIIPLRYSPTSDSAYIVNLDENKDYDKLVEEVKNTVTMILERCGEESLVEWERTVEVKEKYEV